MENSADTIKLGNPGSKHLGTRSIIAQKGLRFPLGKPKKQRQMTWGVGGEEEEKTVHLCATILSTLILEKISDRKKNACIPEFTDGKCTPPTMQTTFYL